MPKVKIFDTDDGGRSAWIDCPACRYTHAFKLDVPQENGAMWTFNEDVDNPTFSPSMMVNRDWPEKRCHSFVRNGKIEFLSDCFHDMKGQTVDLPEVDY